jgi:hypothetical protein
MSTAITRTHLVLCVRIESCAVAEVTAGVSALVTHSGPLCLKRKPGRPKILQLLVRTTITVADVQDLTGDPAPPTAHHDSMKAGDDRSHDVLWLHSRRGLHGYGVA